jgi:saccharopine dehydrogenase-like NADP-dependent oxidoreductase
MDVLVLGAAGKVAQSVIWDLLEFDPMETSQIIAVDRNEKKLNEVVTNYESGKLTPIPIDITDYTSYTRLVGLMKKSSVVVNATVPAGSVPVDVLRAALEARVNILDLGAWPEETRQSLMMNNAFKNAGLTAILGLGSSPGITNLIVRVLADRLESVETIEMSFAYASLGTSTVPIKVPFGGALTEFTAYPEIYRNGQFEKLPPQSGLTDIQYPEPIGIRRSFYVGHSEITTFAESFKNKGVRNISMRAGFTPDFVEKVNFLLALGMLDEEPIDISGSIVVPVDFLNACLDKLPSETGDVVDYGCTRAVVIGRHRGIKVEHIALMPTCYTAARRTGISAAIGTRMLGKGQIAEKGVLTPELGVAPELFFRELARRGIEVTVTSKSFI